MERTTGPKHLAQGLHVLGAAKVRNTHHQATMCSGYVRHKAAVVSEVPLEHTDLHLHTLLLLALSDPARLAERRHVFSEKEPDSRSTLAGAVAGPQRVAGLWLQ